jgi:SAM-dependent methyltransferase
MSKTDVNRRHQVAVPMYEFDEKGHIKPNLLFHRPIDKIHSRCIEYPFAASRIGNAQVILDVGTIKADPAWIAWLENLPVKVHATDYDAPLKPFKNVTFHQADIRRLPLPDCFFDKVIAVSVIEHIGLEIPQVFADTIPEISNDGDLEAMAELTRVLKPGGELIMTVPFGMQEGLILGNQARNYTINSIKKFERILNISHIEYYEYQAKTLQSNDHNSSIKIGFLKKMFSPFCAQSPILQNDDFIGEATWRNIPLDQTMAFHKIHTEGVACVVWEKNIL